MSDEQQHIDDGSVQVTADTLNQKVELLFEGPDQIDEDTGETIPGSGVLEVTLSPELARDLAFTLTKASYAAEGDESLL